MLYSSSRFSRQSQLRLIAVLFSGALVRGARRQMTGQALIVGIGESSVGQSLIVQITLSGVALLLLALAIFVLRARRKAATHRWFAMFTIAVANWTIGIAGLQSGTHLDIWGRFTFANAALIPAASLAFISSYPAQSGWRTLLFENRFIWRRNYFRCGDRNAADCR